MKQKVYITVGLVGSGKSTWAKHKALDKNTIIICKDNLRTMIKGEYVFDFIYEDLIKDLAKFGIRKALQQGHDVIIDETNITKRKRSEWISICTEYSEIGIEILYFLNREFNVENRMGSDSRGYTKEQWQEVYNNMLENFEEPFIDEFSIGNLWVVELNSSGEYTYNGLDQLKVYPGLVGEPGRVRFAEKDKK